MNILKVFDQKPYKTSFYNELVNKKIKVVSEKILEKRLKKYIEGFGGLFFKWTSPGTRGVPDRLAFLPGGFLFIVEAKSKTGRARPAQKVIHKKLSDLGFKVYLIKPENLNDLINDIRASQLPRRGH